MNYTTSLLFTADEFTSLATCARHERILVVNILIENPSKYDARKCGDRKSVKKFG